MSSFFTNFKDGCFSLNISVPASWKGTFFLLATTSIWSSINSVKTKPGHIELQVMGSSAVSNAITFVSPTSPCFDAV